MNIVQILTSLLIAEAKSKNMPNARTLLNKAASEIERLSSERGEFITALENWATTNGWRCRCPSCNLCASCKSTGILYDKYKKNVDN